MAIPIEFSEVFFERVRDFFWCKPERDFVIRMTPKVPMDQWEIIPTHSRNHMRAVRLRLYTEKSEFAGFLWDEGRYSFYFCARDFVKAQYLDNFDKLGDAILVVKKPWGLWVSPGRA